MLAADRSAVTDALRRRVAREAPHLWPEDHGRLFRATALFERAVWLIGRKALLLAPGG
ncbi:hypothetical protein [Muricoccus radiodurans]|uniref:hypothetical protein n=1 Tax=Muricoccus radiodurans TaxID=2231721 RepID=UPI003CF51F60